MLFYTSFWAEGHMPPGRPGQAEACRREGMVVTRARVCADCDRLLRLDEGRPGAIRIHGGGQDAKCTDEASCLMRSPPTREELLEFLRLPMPNMQAALLDRQRRYDETIQVNDSVIQFDLDSAGLTEFLAGPHPRAAHYEIMRADAYPREGDGFDGACFLSTHDQGYRYVFTAGALGSDLEPSFIVRPGEMLRFGNDKVRWVLTVMEVLK